MNFNISRLRSLGVYGAAAAAVCVGAYGVYRYLKKDDGTKTESKKGDDNVKPTPKPAATSAGSTKPAAKPAAPTKSESSSDRSERPVHVEPASVPETANAQAEAQEPVEVKEVTPDLAFMNAVMVLSKPVAAHKDWLTNPNAVFKTKFSTSQPRYAMIGDVMTHIFPISAGLNLIVVGDDIIYLDGKTRQSVKLDLSERSNETDVTPAGQAKIYVYQKCMELFNIQKGFIHPAQAYPANFEVERGLATNHQLKNLDAEKENEFFNLLFASSTKMTTYPFTRSDMAFISTIVNAAQLDEPTRFANLEGDRFVYIADYENDVRNMVLVQRASGYVQLFRAGDVRLPQCKGFQDWMKPVGVIFDMDKQEHLQAAMFMSNSHATDVMSEVKSDEAIA